MNVNFGVDLSNGESVNEAIDQLTLIRDALYEYETPDADTDTSGMEIEQKISSADGGTMSPEIQQYTSAAEQELYEDGSGYEDGPEFDGYENRAGVEVSTITGLPWDSRIHSKNKSKNANGDWKKKRGVDAALVEQVEAELKQLMALPTGNGSQFTPEELAHVPFGDNISNEVMQSMSHHPEPDAAAVFGAPTTSGESVHTGPQNTTPVTNFPLPPVEQTQQPAQTTAVDFTGLLAKVTARISDATKGAVFNEGMKQVLKDSGLASIANLISRPDLVPNIDQKLDTLWNS